MLLWKDAHLQDSAPEECVLQGDVGAVGFSLAGKADKRVNFDIRLWGRAMVAVEFHEKAVVAVGGAVTRMQ